MAERWRDVVGFEGLYQVSDLGRVRTVERVVQGPWRFTCKKPQKLMSPKYQGSRALLTLWDARHPVRRVRKVVRVEEVVWEAFRGHVPKDGKILRKDGDLRNNALSNLCLQENLVVMG